MFRQIEKRTIVCNITHITSLVNTSNKINNAFDLFATKILTLGQIFNAISQEVFFFLLAGTGFLT